MWPFRRRVVRQDTTEFDRTQVRRAKAIQRIVNEAMPPSRTGRMARAVSMDPEALITIWDLAERIERDHT